jgi:hypothetical protein
VMQETTLYYSAAARHLRKQWKPHRALTRVWRYILQYVLAVLVSNIVVSALVPITEHSP